MGQVAFPAGRPVQAGVQAIGRIDWDVYPGGYREGTAICFESFQLWQIGD